MRALQLKYPGLSMPAAALGRFPTRVHRLDAASARSGADVWVKRDDETGTRYGGNKVRKLELLLGAARAHGARRVLTIGAAGSHHVLATGIYARMLGIATTAVLVPQPPTAHVGHVVLADLGAGIDLVAARSDAEGALRFGALVATLTVRDGAVPHPIAVGGSSPEGAIGYVAAGFELATQIRAGEMPIPHAVIVPLGSGGTMAGLWLGLALAGIETEVVGVRVTGTPFSSRRWVARLARRALDRLRRADPLVPRRSIHPAQLVVDADHLGPGYGLSTPAGEDAMRVASEDGLTLDPTYTAKAFAGTLARARSSPGRTILYWHTLSSADVSDLVEAGRSRPVPPSLARYVDLAKI